MTLPSTLVPPSAAGASAQDARTETRTIRRASGPTFVLLGGVPGAGKTTLLRRLRRDRPEVHVVDPEGLRELLRPAPVPYRWYRPLVHTTNAVRLLLVLLRGPGASGASLVVHDPATRPRRRELTGRLARLRGWQPVLVMLDVSRQEALAGQRRRGRVVAASTFDAHWQRWVEQRSRLAAAARDGAVSGPWDRTLVVDRSDAASQLGDLLR
jgi:predicted kinase